VKLADLGVSKKQSERWQKLAALPKATQEAKIAEAQHKAENAINVRVSQSNPPKRDALARCIAANCSRPCVKNWRV
jgi:hypothetical protein